MVPYTHTFMLEAIIPQLGFSISTLISRPVLLSREGAESNFYFIDKIWARKVGDEPGLFGKLTGLKLCTLFALSENFYDQADSNSGKRW